jgi:hypothetical protein
MFEVEEKYLHLLFLAICINYGSFFGDLYMLICYVAYLLIYWGISPKP